MPAELDFKEKLAAFQREFEDALQGHLPPATTRPTRLHTAMRYSVEAGGKRLRPMLALAAADLWGQRRRALAAAVAIEWVHTYSLIHDDLPAMDNDDLRRGRPTCHKQFDEATAILAGDALLTQAFGLLAHAYRNHPPLALELVRDLARCAGSTKLIGGQMEDIIAEQARSTAPEDLDFIHRNKTGAMIQLSLVAGGRCAGANDEEIDVLWDAGAHLGLAFQIIDDILDATSTSATLGKTAGKDERSGKATYVRVHGLAASHTRAKDSSQAAIAAFRRLPGDTALLVHLTEAMLARTN